MQPSALGVSDKEASGGNHGIYDPDTQICCAGRGWDKKIYECCYGGRWEEEYKLNTQSCCGGWAFNTAT